MDQSEKENSHFASHFEDMHERQTEDKLSIQKDSVYFQTEIVFDDRYCDMNRIAIHRRLVQVDVDRSNHQMTLTLLECPGSAQLYTEILQMIQLD